MYMHRIWPTSLLHTYLRHIPDVLMDFGFPEVIFNKRELLMLRTSQDRQYTSGKSRELTQSETGKAKTLFYPHELFFNSREI